jgi:hypothetical protein
MELVQLKDKYPTILGALTEQISGAIEKKLSARLETTFVAERKFQEHLKDITDKINGVKILCVNISPAIEQTRRDLLDRLRSYLSIQEFTLQSA